MTFKEDNLREYDETVSKFERMDRIRKAKKASVITLFAVLLAVIVFYAGSIERRLSSLSDSQSVVVFKSEESATTEKSQANKSEDSYTPDFSEYYISESHTTEDVVEYQENTTKISVGEASAETVTNAADDETYTSESTSLSVASETENKAGTVFYVTKTGKKYHTAGCFYLKSKIEITYDEIVEGGYEPCSRCIR